MPSFRKRRRWMRNRVRHTHDDVLIREIGLMAARLVIYNEILIDRGYPRLLSPGLISALQMLYHYADRTPNETDS